MFTQSTHQETEQPRNSMNLFLLRSTIALLIEQQLGIQLYNLKSVKKT